jgi:Kef-type K+ transport system membrane component KefB
VNHHDQIVIVLGVAVLLGLGRLAAEIARSLRAPPVVGEILAGVVLGPTLLGRISPDALAWLFPTSGAPRMTIEGLRLVSVSLLMLVAGLEIELGFLRRVGRKAIPIGLGGLLFPFGLGLVAALSFPSVAGKSAGIEPLPFALFFGAAMAISALPVIARILLDLKLLKSELGILILASAMLDDIFGWLIFSVVLGMCGADSGASLWHVLVGMLIFAIAVFAIVRPVLERVLPRLQSLRGGPAVVVAPLLALALGGAAVTEAIGTHAVIGAFLVGVVVRTEQLRRHIHEVIEQFVANAFATLYFATIALRVDFVESFSPRLVLLVLGIACAGKLLGAAFGARAAGKTVRDAIATAAGLNARGAMEIVLGELALQHGIIDRPLFTAIVIMALVTSVASGPLLKLFMRPALPSALDETGILAVGVNEN